MKTYGGVDALLHSFLTLLYTGEMSVSHSGRINPADTATNVLLRLGGPQNPYVHFAGKTNDV
jgi:hypothetical protein